MDQINRLARNNVIAVRMSDEELKIFKDVRCTTGKSISEIMREAMRLWEHHYFPNSISAILIDFKAQQKEREA